MYMNKMHKMFTRAKSLISLSLLSIIIIATTYFPVYIWLVKSWLNNPAYQHGFFIPLVVAGILVLRRKYLKMNKPTLTGISILSAGYVTYVLSYIWGIQYLAALSLPIVMSGILYYFLEKKNARRFLSAVFFLLFMIPFPFIYDSTFYLQQFTVFSSAEITGWAGIGATISGNQIQTAAGVFTIGTSCSGINSLIALITLGGIICFVTRGSVLSKSVVFVSTVPIAIVANTIRVSLTMLIASIWGAQVAMEYFHSLSGIVLFLIALVLLLTLARLLKCKFKSLAELRDA